MIKLILISLLSTSCSWFHQKLLLSTQKDIVPLDPTQSICPADSPSQLLTEDRQLYAWFNAIAPKLPTNDSKMLALILLSYLAAPHLASPDARLQIILKNKKNPIYTAYDFIDEHPLNNFYNVIQLFSPSTVKQTIKVLDQYLPQKIAISASFADFLANQESFFQANPEHFYSKHFSRANMPLRENETFFRMNFSELFSGISGKQFNSARGGIHPEKNQQNIVCNFSLSEYQRQLYRVDPIQNTTFGGMYLNNQDFLWWSFSKIPSLNNSSKTEKFPSIYNGAQFKSVKWCYLKSINQFLFSSMGPDAGQPMMSILKEMEKSPTGTKQIAQLIHLPRSTFSVNPTLLYVEGNYTPEDKMQALRELYIPLKYAANLSKIWGKTTQPFPSLIRDMRYPSELDCKAK